VLFVRNVTNHTKGTSIAQAISRQHPIAGARIRSQVRSYRFVTDKMILEYVISKYLSSPVNSHSTKSSTIINIVIWGW
jgi:hypothetical protein